MWSRLQNLVLNSRAHRVSRLHIAPVLREEEGGSARVSSAIKIRKKKRPAETPHTPRQKKQTDALNPRHSRGQQKKRKKQQRRSKAARHGSAVEKCVDKKNGAARLWRGGLGFKF